MSGAAIGVRVHSGWGALVAVTGAPGAIEIIERRRIEIINPKSPGAKQPFHYAERIGLPKAEKHLAECEAETARLAFAAIRDVVEGLASRQYRIAGAAILLASGRALPPLPDILRSHAMIHTAEGEFFRDSFRRAFEQLGLPISGIRERELEKFASEALGIAAARVRQRIASAGKALGPPWTQDHKLAALAACLLLAGKEK